MCPGYVAKQLRCDGVVSVFVLVVIVRCGHRLQWMSAEREPASETKYWEVIATIQMSGPIDCRADDEDENTKALYRDDWAAVMSWVQLNWIRLLIHEQGRNRGFLDRIRPRRADEKGCRANQGASSSGALARLQFPCSGLCLDVPQ